MYDLVSNIHFDWIYKLEPMARNCGISIRRVAKDGGPALGYIIVVDHNPEHDLLSFQILKTTINFYIKECKEFENSLQLRIPVDENFEFVEKMLEEDINASFFTDEMEYKKGKVKIYKMG